MGFTDVDASQFFHINILIKMDMRHSEALIEGGVAAFDCQILPSNTPIYILVERRDNSLVYSCFQDEDIWAASHREHEKCRGGCE
jgi:hypothetical protein